MMKKLLSLVFNRWVLAALGLGAIGLLIWFGGPLVAIASYRPLETDVARMVLIGALVAFYLVRIAVRSWKSRRANTRLMEGLLKQPSPPAAGASATSEEEIGVLRERFEEAIAVLRKARLEDQGKPSLWSRLRSVGRHTIYDLPWYIFIGAPGSGKTTALINSGLQFPLADQFGRGAIRGVGGTRNCDWWFTNRAVLIDTAGRYTTQESNREADSAAWFGFLQLLKKYRSRRPINGVMLTLSVADLLEPSATRRETHIHAMRTRIEELHQQLNIRFPLYVLVTKMDLLVGFMEFFSELNKEEREQVWGVSFPYTATGLPPSQESFAQEFAALEHRINARLIDRLQQERDPQKRAQLYVFPQQFRALRSALEDVAGQLFAPSRFTEKPLLRGVYFNSGTQEGSPIDRVMGKLGRALRLDNKLLMPNQSSGKSFFLTRLLNDVVFQEAGLAGTNLRWEKRRFVLHGAVMIGAIVMAAGAIALWAMSYTRNSHYVVEVDARRAAVATQLATLGSTRNSNLVELLPVLASAQHMADVPGATGGTPASMSMGLYQGDKLASAARHAYRNLLRDSLLPRLALRIEQQLRSDARANPEMLYEGLKAYIMLHDPAHYQAAALKAYITADWENGLPREVTTAQRKELEGHLNALLDSGDTVASPVPADARLIADSRVIIASTPLASRVYNRLKRQGVAAGFPEFTIASAGGPTAALVFTRASGQPLTNGIPGLYSFNGYHKAFIAQSERVATQLADEEPWVLGTQGVLRLADPSAKSRLVDDVRRLYLEDYAKLWEAFIGDIRLVRAASLQQSIELARILSSPDSPLPLLMRAIVKEVTLVQVEEADKSTLNKAGDKISSARDDLLKLFGQQKAGATPAAVSRPENLVDQRFENLRRLVRTQGSAPAPIDSTVALINELYTMLIATDAAVKGGNTPPPSDVPNKIKAEGSRMPEPVRSVLLTLSGGGTSQAMGVTRANLSQAMRTSVFEFCNKAIAGRYPFTKSSARDVTQEDFARLFSANGILDEFFQKNLAPFVNTATRPWTFRNMGEASLGGASSALVQFQRAQAIREVFFRNGQAATMRLEFRPIAMDTSITQFILDVDGQLVKYSHGPQVPTQVQWPGPRGTMQVRVQLSPPSTSGASGEVYEGAWALFRMFDRVQIDSTTQPEKFVSTFTVDGRRAQFDVLTSSVQNPFRLRELEQFQCPSQL